MHFLTLFEKLIKHDSLITIIAVGTPRLSMQGNFKLRNSSDSISRKLIQFATTLCANLFFRSPSLI